MKQGSHNCCFCAVSCLTTFWLLVLDWLVGRPLQASLALKMSLPAVTVSCRIRPRNPKADLAGGVDCIHHDEHSIRLADRPQTFTFDSIFGPAASQEDIFNSTSKPLVDAALGGINATIMTYGQVGLPCPPHPSPPLPSTCSVI